MACPAERDDKVPLNEAQAMSTGLDRNEDSVDLSGASEEINFSSGRSRGRTCHV